jgi:hypothetical protein
MIEVHFSKGDKRNLLDRDANTSTFERANGLTDLRLWNGGGSPSGSDPSSLPELSK